MKKNIKYSLILCAIFLFSYLLSFFQEPAVNPLDASIMESLKNFISFLDTFFQANPLLVSFAFVISFFLLTIAYVPFTGSIYVLFAGALFGKYNGILYFSFLLSFSYTMSFLISKYLFNNFFEKKLSLKAHEVIHGFEKDGWVYLLSIRLSGVIPGFVVNTAMSVTNIPAWQFYSLTQIGTFPQIAIYVTAGSQLHKIQSLNDIVSPSILFFLVILSIIPLFVKIGFDFLISKRRKDESV